jgi:hypothetical protein
MHINRGPVVQLRMDKFREQEKLREIESFRGWAELLDVAQTTVIRLFAGETDPSNAFIARTLTALAPLGFGDLFIVVADREPVPA